MLFRSSVLGVESQFGDANSVDAATEASQIAFFGDAFFTGQWWFVGDRESGDYIPISSVLVFDIGVYLVVFGSILTLVLALEEEV